MSQKLFKRDANKNLGLPRAKSKGFTLIEVVIVLAIAGLIFVIIFLAVAAAQRARRDNARQQAASRFLAAADQYAGNCNGTYPGTGSGTCAGWPLQYFNNQGNPDNPAGAWAFGGPAIGSLSFDTGTTCENTAVPRVARVRTGLEGGATYCIDNN